MTIRTALVPLSEIVALRHRILRPGLPLESAAFAEDDRPETFHVAAYDGDGTEALGCITVFPDLMTGAEGAVAYRFRGMATAEGARGRGFGAAVLEAATAEAAARGAELMWCNGRSVARGFYERQGYAVQGEEFQIEGVGPHYVFARKISL
ncbi:GNAT family N-acetyltransferase [Streptomyces litchfieldiae]|uniref:GNAT family N-acetyltransferase n=1 Tax=Streptomyces litchfieldiae TaxID=3075543 RepID=A0ABU2MUA0_9ACTN|nr:GNAT family N-acetyltransferase [Streptomyces sp. DSM 44938]MDT0345212.1 GNAT family N-acetyltransferase [Streptomyces sp. DSM 44938]